MVKHIVGVRTVGHRIVESPRRLSVVGQSYDNGTSSGMDAIRGVGLAVVLSAVCWVALLAAV